MESPRVPAAAYIPPSDIPVEPQPSHLGCKALALVVAGTAAMGLTPAHAEAPTYSELPAKTLPATADAPARKVVAENVEQPIPKKLKKPKIRIVAAVSGKVAIRATSDSAKHRKNCAYLTPEESGFVIGTVCKGDDVTILHNSGYQSMKGKYAYVMARRHGKIMCGFIDLGIVPAKKMASGNRPSCNKSYRTRTDRSTFGRDFNCAPHQCVGGKAIVISDKCNRKLYSNYYPNSSGPNNVRPNGSSGFYKKDLIGTLKKNEVVSYRFTWRGTSDDGRAIEVGTKRLGWGALEIDCIKGLAHKELLGGPAKHALTVPGLRPNAALKGKKAPVVTAAQVLRSK